jgi:hypothetical protein
MQNVLVPTGARMRITAKQKKEKAPCPFQVHCPQVAFEPVEARAQQTFWFCCDLQLFQRSCSSKNPNLPRRLTFCIRRVLVKVSTISATSLSDSFAWQRKRKLGWNLQATKVLLENNFSRKMMHSATPNLCLRLAFSRTRSLAKEHMVTASVRGRAGDDITQCQDVEGSVRTCRAI